MDNSKRTIYFDYLRVFAMFAVMFLHTASSNWHSSDVNGFNWQVFNAYDSVSRWGVPIFVMISGALFLGRSIPTKIIYTKYITRIVTAYFFWSGFYALLDYDGITQFIAHVISGHFHMWFLPMIVGLYMAMPIIKCITADEKVTFYFLILSVTLAIIIPTFVALSNDFAPRLINEGVQRINKALVGGLKLNIVLGFTIYFILGYVISNIEINIKQRKLIYVLGLIGFIATIVLDAIVAIKKQTPCSTYYDFHMLGVFLEGLSIFVLLKYNCPKSERMNAFVQNLSKYSFGAYLIHPFVQKALRKIGFTSLTLNSAFAVPLLAITIFTISMLISAVLNRIPVINRYIV